MLCEYFQLAFLGVAAEMVDDLVLLSVFGSSIDKNGLKNDWTV